MTNYETPTPEPEICPEVNLDNLGLPNVVRDIQGPWVTFPFGPFLHLPGQSKRERKESVLGRLANT